MRLVEIPLDDARWPAFLERSRHATIFHSPAWVRTLGESYGFRGFALGLADEHGRIRGLLPMAGVDLPLRGRRWVSLPFTDVCPPLFDPGIDEAAVYVLLDQAGRDAGVNSIEVRAPLAGGSLRARGVEHVLPLGSDPDELRHRFKKTTWQKVRQAERQGLHVRVATRPEDLARHILRAASRLRGGARGCRASPAASSRACGRTSSSPVTASCWLRSTTGGPLAGRSSSRDHRHSSTSIRRHTPSSGASGQTT